MDAGTMLLPHGKNYMVRAFSSLNYHTYSVTFKYLTGDIFYMTALGRGILVVNSLAIAEELAVKRATTYSGRPHFTMVGDL
jgi:hypothetical protein